MKYFIFAVILTITTIPIYAQNLNWNRLGYCDKIYKLAEFVMELRQRGVPKAEVMEVVLNNPRTDPEIVEIVNNAYQVPRYPPGHYQLAIDAFGQKSRLECLYR